MIILYFLVVIVTIIRSPSLHRPVNVLLCSLAASDCLTGLVLQPVYVAWRFLLHHSQDPCELVYLYQASKSLPQMLLGFTFLNLAITSAERLYAVSRPLEHSAKVTLRGMNNSTRHSPLQVAFACAWTDLGLLRSKLINPLSLSSRRWKKKQITDTLLWATGEITGSKKIDIMPLCFSFCSF